MYFLNTTTPLQRKVEDSALCLFRGKTRKRITIEINKMLNFQKFKTSNESNLPSTNLKLFNHLKESWM